MIACPACGTENPPRARFCMECASPLQEAPRPTEERRLVSILFVDLVGFTERSDHADPEDVRRTLVPFHTRVKADLERFGGTLDKFIGDAALGVFGAPVAHGDDPVRAVRAGLAILRSIEELRAADPALAVRVAVNTGEAVVSFGAGPQVGEAVAGDVVNTASRMQALAAPGSMVIGEGTLAAVRDAFEVEELPPTLVKGKSEPIRVWRVLGQRAEPSSVQVGFVGRRRELDELEGLVDAAAAASAPFKATVVGEPGIGKTRLVAELRSRVTDRTRWLRGRTTPYGESPTFGPAAETIRTLAGIEPGDDVPTQGSRLEMLVAQVESEADEREWLTSTLGAVLGIGEPAPGAAIPVEEIARAWSSMLAWAAATGPTLVVELDDLHWAEPAFLELVDMTEAGLAGRPAVVLSVARPELFDRAPGWADGHTVLRLDALSPEESTALVDGLLGTASLLGPARTSLVQRAGGNPLYALEFARMLAEGGAPEGATTDMPGTVRGVIGARLDAIRPELRGVVLDASVVGMTFWTGMLAAVSGRIESEVASALEALSERGLVRRAPTSSIPGTDEYGFAHALIGEVAYARIPRAERARRHAAAAEWIERVDPDQAPSRAEILARNYAAATELAEAAGEPDIAEQARRPAVRWLMAAGERAGRLDARGAFELYDRAATLAIPDSSARAEALAHSAQMGRRSGLLDGRDVLARHEAALGIYEGLQDALGIGRALTRVGSQLGALGEFGRSEEVLAEAVRTLEAQPHGPDLAAAYAYLAEAELFAGRARESMAFAARTLDLLPEGSNDDLVVMALHIRGDARASLGEAGGLQDLREALRISEATGSASGIVVSNNYLAEWLWATEGPAAAMVHLDAARRLAERRGVVSQGLWTKAGAIDVLFDFGDWDRALMWGDEILALGREHLDGVIHAVATAGRARLLLYRGGPNEAGDASGLAGPARDVQELHALAPALLVAAEVSSARGRHEDAMAFVEELDRATAEVAPTYREARLAPLARVCARAGELGILERLVDRSEGTVPRDRLHRLTAQAVLAEAGGDPAAANRYEQAALGWREFGIPLEEAMALLGLAAVRTGTPNDPRAREILQRLGVPFDHPLLPGGRRE